MGMDKKNISSNFGLYLFKNESNNFIIFGDFGPEFSFWVNGVLTMCLIIIGIIGNVAIVISLYCNTKKWLALYYYFMAFAIWNTTLLVSTIFVYCIPALTPDETGVTINGYVDFINFSLIGYPVANCGMTASIWLVLSLTVERYMAVVKPLNLISSTPKRRARFVVAAISILAPVYNLPLYFELRAIHTADGEVDVAKTSLRDDPFYKIAYRVVGNAVFLSIVPLLSIVAMSTRIVYIVRTLTNEDRYNYFSESDQEYNLIDVNGLGSMKMDRRRSSLSRCHSRIMKHNTHRTHLTLAALAAKFVLCYTLPTLLNILEIVLEPSTLTACGLSFLVDISNFMVVMDSAMNGFIYFSWRRRIAIYYRKQQAPAMLARYPTPSSVGGGASVHVHLSPTSISGLPGRRHTMESYGRRYTMESTRRSSALTNVSWNERVSSL